MGLEIITLSYVGIALIFALLSMFFQTKYKFMNLLFLGFCLSTIVLSTSSASEYWNTTELNATAGIPETGIFVSTTAVYVIMSLMILFYIVEVFEYFKKVK